MKVVLTLPIYKDRFDWNKWYDQIAQEVGKNNVDLIVFPEGFRSPIKKSEIILEVKNFAKDFKIPVIMGIGGDDGSQWAVYYNPNPKVNETISKIYCKHSTADVTAFDYSNYDKDSTEYFKPIILKNKRIQVNICHDIFFPLITEKMEVKGMDMLINLTGGNVNLNKWHTVFKGRSLETPVPILCSMGFNPYSTGKSECFAFQKGQKIKPNLIKGNVSKDDPEMLLFDLNHIIEDKSFNINSSLSEKSYNDFLISFNKKIQDAHLNIEINSGQLQLLLGEKVKYRKEDVLIYTLQSGELTVYILPYSQLISRYAVNSLDFKNGSKYFILLYHSSENVNENEGISLLKLRAIENRVGCILAAPNLKVVLKTNRYKNIQQFNTQSDLIGFDLNFIEGLESVFNSTNSTLGIKKEHSIKYRNILDSKDEN